jgi:hypothetical protein
MVQVSDVALLDGRFSANVNADDTLAPPTEIYHPASTAFVARLNDPGFKADFADNEEFIRHTAELMRKSSQIHTEENNRTEVVRDILADILGVAFTRS